MNRWGILARNGNNKKLTKGSDIVLETISSMKNSFDGLI